MIMPTDIMDEIHDIVAFACDHCGGGYEWECDEPGDLDYDDGPNPDMNNNHMRARRLLKVLDYYLEHQERP